MAAFVGTAFQDSIQLRIELKTCGLQSRSGVGSCPLNRPFLTLGMLGGFDAVE